MQISMHQLGNLMNSEQQRIADKHLEKIKEYYNVLHSSPSYDDGFGCQTETNFMAKYYNGLQTPYEEFRVTIFRRAQAVYKCDPKELTLEQLRQIGGDL